jgi:hypothetical protein
MKSRPASYPWLAVLLLAATVSAGAALTGGSSAYTKRFKTTLLAEPSPLAQPAGELPYGRKVTVNEVRGNWLRISDGPAAGWVFAGNLSEAKPAESKGLDGVPLAASDTTATAAARPLTPVSVEYATRNNLVNAREDLDWLRTQNAAVTPEVLQEFLQAQKKGEFQ